MTTVPLSAAGRTYGWRTWRDAVREALIAALIGAAATFIHTGPTAWPEILRNAHTAVAMALAARGLETALSWAIEQSSYATFFRTLIYVLGGGVAWFLAGGHDFDLMHSTLVAFLIALTIAFILHHNRKRSAHLRQSIERLKEHEFAEKELAIARDMQQRLLPPPIMERDGFRVTARTRAAHLVGGDFYDVLRISDAQTAILAADVSGKGMAASLIMASCKAMIPFLASARSAADVMHDLNARLCEQLSRREFVAMVLVRFEPSSGIAEIVNAGMPDALIVRKDGVSAVHCEGDRLPLGAMKGTRYQSTTLTLHHGERLLLFSDGLPEATIDGSPIGYDRVEEVAARTATVDAFIDELCAAPGIHIDDDVTVVALELTEHTTAPARSPA